MPISPNSAYPDSHDLNFSNRPVRTRMPGGVGGDRSGILTAPIPILVRPVRVYSCGCKSHLKLITANEAKRNCMRVTECGKEAWSEAASR